jgi:glycopeptide antibiotics resistance protein
VILNIIGNIVAFIPFGFFLPEINKKFSNVILVIFAGMFFSLGVELLQAKYQIGSFDVDDIILNTTGTFTGVILFKIYVIIRKIQRLLQRKE